MAIDAASQPPPRAAADSTVAANLPIWMAYPSALDNVIRPALAGAPPGKR